MLNFKDWLIEASYVLPPENPYFYCACRLNIPELLKMELHGLDGISSSPEILKHLDITSTIYGGAKVALKMPSHDVFKLNNLTKILYDNPDYLASQGGDAFKRLFAGTYHFNKLVYDLANISLGSSPQSDYEYELSREKEFDIKKLLSSVENIKSIDDLVNKIVIFAKQKGIKANRDAIKNYALHIVKSMGNLFKSEKEWRTKPKWQKIEGELKKIRTLKIPNTTEMMIIWVPIIKDEDIVELKKIYKKVITVGENHRKYIKPFVDGTLEVEFI